MYCSHCGSEIKNNLIYCENCGAKNNNQAENNSNFSSGNWNNNTYNNGNFNGNNNYNNGYNNQYNQNYQRGYGYNQQNGYYREVDAPSAGFGVLGFFFPMIGLILYIIWHDTYPLKAKSCGKGALISVITGVVLYVFLIFFICLLAAITY